MDSSTTTTAVPRPPRAFNPADQARVDALAAEAAADLPPQPSLSQRANVVRLLVAAVAACGSVRWAKGWTGAFMERMAAAGCPAPAPAVLAWYLKRLREDPLDFLDVPGVDPDVLQDIADGVCD
jgi:hypothetical protein